MNVDILAFFAPLISVVVFYFYDRVFSVRSMPVKQRISTILGIQFCNLLLSLFLSLFFLVPFVYVLAPIQIFSFSQLSVPIPVSFVLSFLFLDFINYCQHRLHHKIPFLWRLHRLHHSDQHMDAFTTVLHHPLEVVSSFVLVISAAVLFDIPVIVLVTYGIISGLHAGFTHTRKLLPDGYNRYVQYFLVTPNVHRLHHALNMKEGNSNFGIMFIFWDLLFKTLISQPQQYVNKLPLGIDKKQQPDKINFVIFIKNIFI